MTLNRMLPLLLVVMIASVLVTSCGEKSGAGTAVDENAAAHQFGQEIDVQEPLNRLAVSQSVKVPVSVRNTSNFTWRSSGDHPVRFAYHWFDKDGRKIVHDGERTLLAEDLPAGATAKLMATVIAPSSPGEYTLRLTFVQEGIAWFYEKGAKPVEIEVRVEAR